METLDPSPIPESELLEEKYGIKFYSLKKTLLLLYEPKIKIFSVGKENNLGTKNIILMGATGSGKTTLINALINHVLEVKFEYCYRYVLKDETGDYQKTHSVSQTDYVVGYLIYAPPSSNRNYNYMIIDTPGFKDSRGEQRDQEVVEQIKTFLQNVDGVDELHCIGFLVNGTIARLQNQFEDILNTFCEVFSENVDTVIKVLISFAHMKKPPVHHVLDNSYLKEFKRIKFDNVSLYDCNQLNEDCSEEEITVSRSFWDASQKVYDSFLSEINCQNPVCLGMTREILKSIQDLHMSIDYAKEEVALYLDLMTNLLQLENECMNHKIVMEANENFTGTVQVEVRRRLKLIDQILKFQTHDTKMEDRPVVYEDKKKSYEEAKYQETLILKQIDEINVCIIEKIEKVKYVIKDTVDILEKIKSSSLKYETQTTENLVDQLLTDVKMEKLNKVTNAAENKGIIVPVLKDLNEQLNEFVATLKY